MNIINPYDFDDETGEEGENENHIIFYIGNDYDADDSVFEWYGCEYFLIDAPQRVEMNCPIVILNTPYSESLDALFGDDWYGPFATWFTKRYDLPVKIVLT